MSRGEIFRILIGMLSDTHHPHQTFFQNKEINSLYISVFIMNVAESLMSIFVPLYLYSLGYSVITILFFFFLHHLFSTILHFPLAKVVAYFGPKPSIALSIPFLVAYYLGLRILPDFSWLFYLLPLFLTLRNIFYNLGYDLNYFQHRDRNHTGRQISFLGILSIAAGIFSPFLAGFIISTFTYAALFGTGAILLTLSVLPLFVVSRGNKKLSLKLSDIFSLFKTEGMKKTVISFSGYALESSIGRIIWPLFLLLVLENTKRVGILVSLSSLVTAIVLAVMGKLTDKHSPKKLLKVTTGIYFLGWMGSGFVSSPLTVWLAESYRKISEQFVLVPWCAAFYTLGEKKKYFAYAILRDWVFNASRVVLFPLLMAIFAWSHSPFLWSFLLASVCVLAYPLLVPQEET